jgi:putative tricarboxylic transport membrane protein
MSWLRNPRNDQVSGLMLVALALFVAWENRTYPLGTLQEPGPAYTPLLFAGFLGLMGLLIVLRGRSSPRLAETPWPEAPRALVILIACGVATYVLEPLGYRLTVAALLVFFLGVVERRKPVAVAAVSIGFSVLSFYLIGDLLRVPLPVGPWGW